MAIEYRARLLPVLLNLLAASMLAAVELPAQALDAALPLTARVTDLTGTLSGAAVNRLESQLGAFAAAHGPSISVLIVPTTSTVEIERFPVRLDPRDVVLLVAKNDRRAHIDVGTALTSTLPESVAGRIVRDALTPRLEFGDYDGGVESAIDAIVGVLEGRPFPERDTRWESRGDPFGGPWAWLAGCGLGGLGLLAILWDRRRGLRAAEGVRASNPDFGLGGASGRWDERAQRPHCGAIRCVIETPPLSQVSGGRSARARALELFTLLRVGDTPRNDEVLIYIQLGERALEIVADRGLSHGVGQTEWEAVCRLMETHFCNGRHAAGASAGVDAVGALRARSCSKVESQ